MSEIKRTWTGGQYAEREGIELIVTPAGLGVTIWFDGGATFEWPDPFVTWDELEELRHAALLKNELNDGG